MNLIFFLSIIYGIQYPTAIPLRDLELVRTFSSRRSALKKCKRTDLLPKSFPEIYYQQNLILSIAVIYYDLLTIYLSYYAKPMRQNGYLHTGLVSILLLL